MSHPRSCISCVRLWPYSSALGYIRRTGPQCRLLYSTNAVLRNGPLAWSLRDTYSTPPSRLNPDFFTPQVNCTAVLEPQVVSNKDPVVELQKLAVKLQNLAVLYPSAPTQLFTEPWDKSLWQAMLQRTPTVTVRERQAGGYKCTVNIRIPGEISPIAKSWAEDEWVAFQGAHRKLVIYMHHLGLLRNVFNNPQALTRKAKRLEARRNRDAEQYLNKIYEYCASCLLAPSFKFEYSDKTCLYHVTISLPDDNDRILGAGSATTPFGSLIHSLESAGKISQTADRKSAVIYPTFKNSSQFIDFCKLGNLGDYLERGRNRGSIDFEIQNREIGMLVSCYLDGQEIGPPAFVMKKEDAESVAILSAAVHLARVKPEMWKAFAAEQQEVPVPSPSHAETIVVTPKIPMQSSAGDVAAISKTVDRSSTSNAIANPKTTVQSSIDDVVAVPEPEMQTYNPMSVGTVRNAVQGSVNNVVKEKNTLIHQSTEKVAAASTDGMPRFTRDSSDTKTKEMPIPAIEKEQNSENLETSNFEKEKKQKLKKKWVIPSVEVLTTSDMPSLMLSLSRDMLHVPEGERNELALPDNFVYRGLETWVETTPGCRNDKRSRQLLADYRQLRLHSTAIREKIDALPINDLQQRLQICSMVSQNTYSIVVGATGSGKTTQLPQMLLEAAIIQGEGSTVEIVCTQPRRIAAKSAARRVAFERNESLRQTVGYAVKDDTKLPINNGNITYCTTGVLLSRLRQSPERTMDMVTHIIVDEVHERDALIDFLMVNLKGLIRNRKAAGKRIPHVVLMSATLDINLFSNYFGEEQEDGLIKPCPSITVPGRSFPIQVKYLDDILEEVKGHSKHREWASLVRTPEVRKFLKRDGLRLLEESQPNIAQQTSIVSQPPAQIQDHHIEGFLPQLHLICATIDYILSTTSEGAILVFLPGMREIRLINSLLEEPHQEIQFIDMPSVKIYQLHSQLAQSQDDVFNSPPPGIRKVILATNIAETSLTIPDVRYVVDSGLYRENGFDQVTNMRSLQARWISKSSSKQRAGRAGRVAEGHYYGMFSKARFESFNPITTAELLRTDLQHICLQIKIRSPDCDISTELAGAIEAPEPGKIRAAIQALKDLDALTENEELTQLGSLLASLPVHPAMGKMVMLGIIFRCLDPMLILAASEQFRTLHMLPPQQRKAAANMRREFCHNTRSDHVSTINAFRWARSMQWDASFQELMAGRFLDAREFGRINTIILSIELTLVDSGLIPPMTEEDVRDLQYGHPSLNENSNNLSLIKALVVAGNPKNIAVASKPNALEISATRIFFMNWASSNFIERKVDRDNWRRKPELYVYNELFDSGRGTTIGGTTLCPPLIAAIFASQATIRPSTSSTGKDSLLLNEFLPVELRTEGDMGDVQPAQAIMTFRQAIRKVQTRAFGKLSQLYAKDSGRYLADEPAQNELIARLAHIISLADTAEVDESVESMVEDMEQVIERDLHSRKVGGG